MASTTLPVAAPARAATSRGRGRGKPRRMVISGGSLIMPLVLVENRLGNRSPLGLDRARMGAAPLPNPAAQVAGRPRRPFGPLAADPWRIPVVVPGGADAGIDRDGCAGDPRGERRGNEGD